MLGTTALLGAITIAFVLIVLPRRFVLQGDLRASGVSFPTTRVPFQPAEVSMHPSRPVPEPRPGADHGVEPLRQAEAVEPTPGPAEQLWARVGPLMEAGQNGAAIEVFDAYLASHPSDVGARVERAIAMVRAGRVGNAEWAFRDLITETNDDRARIELSRLVLARGLPERAESIISAVPADSPLADEAALVADEIRLASAPPAVPVAPDTIEAPQPESPLDAGRLALATGDLDRARASFETALDERPDDPALLLEWADASQFRFEDLEGTIELLERRAVLVTPTTKDRFRLAQLYVWTGAEADGERLLRQVVSADARHPEAWALLGDLNRWAGRRAASAAAYERALTLDPGSEVALAGVALLNADTRRAIRSVDTDRARPTISFFEDSDGFERLEARAYASLLPIPEVLEVEVGARRLRGIDALGAPGTDDGGFGEVTFARWWREGHLRTALTIGAEHSGSVGTDGVLGGRVRVLDLYGWNLDARLRAGPAHNLTSTLGSVSSGLRARQLTLNYFRGLPAGFELSGSVEGAVLSGGGADVTRFAAGAAVSRMTDQWLRTGLSSRYIRYSAEAPRFGDRALFWDPELFWSNGLLVEIRTPRTSGDGTSGFLRATPGIALAEERGASREWISQFEAAAGLRVERSGLAVTLEGFYSRGREGGYTSKGLTLGLEVTR